MKSELSNSKNDMTAVIFDIKHFAVHDGAGIRSTVFFKGCPFNCLWCHNPEGIDIKAQLQYAREKCVNCGICANVCQREAHVMQDNKHVFVRDKCVVCGECAERCPTNACILAGREMTVEQVLRDVETDRLFYEKSGGGVTLSGGECLLQAEFSRELLKCLKAIGVNTAVDTCGHVPRESIDAVAPYTDVFLFDVKHIDPELHKAYTGATNELILDNLRYIDSLGKTVEVRIPLIPGINDDDKTISGIGAFLSSLACVSCVRLLRYNDLAGSKYAMLGKANTQPRVRPQTDDDMLDRKALLEKYRLNVVY